MGEAPKWSSRFLSTYAYTIHIQDLNIAGDNMVEEEATGTPPKLGTPKQIYVKNSKHYERMRIFSHIRSSGSAHVCEVNFMASSIPIMEFFFHFSGVPTLATIHKIV
jgi:hypothetical protein